MSRTSMLALALAVIGLAAALLAYATRDSSGNSATSTSSTTIPQPTAAQLQAAYLGKLPVAPESERVDVVAPTFSNPTSITNPLFPISDLHSAVLNGTVDGKPFHTETTLLPGTRIFEWTEGQRVETRISQYVAYLDGRVEEVALDYYAQADDGSVWYFGEDVFNYDENGNVADTEGTWHADREGPPALIMPASPKVGDVHRPENIPGLVFEEVSVKTIDKTVAGPRGLVRGALVSQELHQDGTYSDKVFAPGYGEFYSAHGGDVEALALAVPTDALGSVPAGLEALSTGADEAFAAIRARDWKVASASVGRLDAAWLSYRTGQVPPRISTEMTRAITALDRAVFSRDRARAATAAIDVAQSALDLELRHRPPSEVDLARFELWVRQLVVDASAGSAAGVRGDLATLEWIRDRFAGTFDAVDLTRVDTQLVGLRGALNDDDLRGVASRAERFRDTLARIEATG